MAEQTPPIFLSYSREDVSFARALREWLLARGHQPWMDLFDIPAGARWPDEIDRALRSAEIVIGLMSPNSIASENVKNEWDWAIANNRRLILLLIEPCEVPFHYVSRNHLDFTGERDEGYAALDEALRNHWQTVAGDGGREGDTSSDPIPLSHLTKGAGAGISPAGGSRLRRALSRRREAPELVGREQEQQELREQLERAIGGEGGLLLLGGEAGIGKTTLAGWLRGEAAGHGALALTGGCYDLTVTPPYGPWIEVLRAYQPDEGLPEIPPQIRDEAGLESLASQAALFEIVGEFFAEVSEQRPLLLILEDLHWADPASLEFLRFFARFLGGLPILLVATYRDDELTRRHPLFELMPLLTREAEAHRLLLNRLDEQGAHDLIAARYSLTPDDTERLIGYLQQLSGGNPFFTRELLQSLVEQGILSADGDGWSLGALDDLRVPPLIREVIESRLARLGDGVREALEIAAVIGQSVQLDLWSAVVQSSEEQMIRALEQATAAQVLEQGATAGEVAFSHALMRETLYEGIVLLRRRMLHKRIGEILAETPQADPDAVAHHFRQAADHRAVEWLLRAAQRAERRYSWIMASERYEAALQMLGDDESRERERGWLLLHIGRLLRFSARDSALVYLDEARRIGNRAGDRRLDASALWLAGICHLIEGEVGPGLREKERALTTLETIIADPTATTAIGLFSDDNAPPADFRLMPWLLTSQDLGPEHTILGWATLSHWTAHAAKFKRAAEFAAKVQRSENADARSHLLQQVVHQQAVRGNPANARAASKMSYRFNLSIGHYIPAAATLINHVIAIHLPYSTDDLEERRWLIEATYESQWRSTYTSGVNPVGRGLQFVSFYEGRWDEAERAGIAGFERLAPGIWRPLAAATLALLAHYRGDDHAAWGNIHAIFPEVDPPEPGETYYIMSIYLLRAAIEIALDSEDLDTARTWLETYGTWLDWAGAVLGRAEEQLFWARYHRLAGDPGKARQHAGRALERAIEPRQPLALIAVHRFLGTLDTDNTRYTDAEGHFKQSRQLAEACALPFERALTLLEVARLHLATGGHDRARSSLAEVRTICEPLGAKLALDRVSHLEAKLEDELVR